MSFLAFACAFSPSMWDLAAHALISKGRSRCQKRTDLGLASCFKVESSLRESSGQINYCALQHRDETAFS